MECQNCGNPLSEDAKFCSKCGQPVVAAEETVQETKVPSLQEMVQRDSAVQNQQDAVADTAEQYAATDTTEQYTQDAVADTAEQYAATDTTEQYAQDAVADTAEQYAATDTTEQYAQDVVADTAAQYAQDVAADTTQQYEQAQSYQQDAPQYEQSAQQYQQNTQSGQQNTQSGPQYQQSTQGTQQTNEFVEKMKKGLSEILAIAKAPATKTKELACQENLLIGLEYMVIKAVLTLIVGLIAFHATVGGYGSYLGLSTGKVMLYILVLTVGVDCLEAVALKLISDVFHYRVDMGGMFVVVGVRALYEAAYMIVGGLCMVISSNLGVVVMGALALAFPVIQFVCYQGVVDGEENKKAYVYILGKMCAYVVSAIIVYLLFDNLVGSISGGISGLLSGLY